MYGDVKHLLIESLQQNDIPLSLHILMEIDFMVESDSYGSDHFPIILKIGV